MIRCHVVTDHLFVQDHDIAATVIVGPLHFISTRVVFRWATLLQRFQDLLHSPLTGLLLFANS